MEGWELLRIKLSAVCFSCGAFMGLLSLNPYKERAFVVTIGNILGTTTFRQYAYNVLVAVIKEPSRMQLRINQTRVGVQSKTSLIGRNARK